MEQGGAYGGNSELHPSLLNAIREYFVGGAKGGVNCEIEGKKRKD